MTIKSSFFRYFRCLIGCISFLFNLPAVSAQQWNEQVLYSFQGLPDGATPVGGMVFDKQGNLYGATSEGGSSACAGAGQCGTVFQLSPPTKQGDPWTETVLYVFKGRTYGDGGTPAGGLIMDAAGNLYGTTAYNGTGSCTLLGAIVGCGIVYELSPPAQPGGAWTETVLYSFEDITDGYFPQGDLVFDSAGNLYGATQFGGGKGTNCNSLYGYCGTVFELSPPKIKGGSWSNKTLHSFAGIPGRGGPDGVGPVAIGDGAAPNGGLVLDNAGNLYGTTEIGGMNCLHHSNQGCGAVFELEPTGAPSTNWTETVLYRFDGANAANPLASLICDDHHNLYGTTEGGGSGGRGVVFRLEAPRGKFGTWLESELYDFSGNNNGANPMAGLTLGNDGSLYGTTNSGTTRSSRGNVFQLSPSMAAETTWSLDVLYTFGLVPDGENPSSNLIIDGLGNLYGATQNGGTGSNCGVEGCGAIFKLTR
jgi:uncharacterized repeat protein (TIGR03803 family)